MDIYSVLKKDHRKVEDLFEQLTNARSDNTRQQLLDTIHDELMLHMKAEEATLYATLEETSETHLEELMPEVEEEHDGAREYFEKIAKAKLGSPKWFILVGELKHAIKHHVEEEEGMVFKHAREVLSDAMADELGMQFKALKQKQEPTEERLHEAPKKAA